MHGVRPSLACQLRRAVDRLRTRHGKQNRSRAMVAVLALGREFGNERLQVAVASTVSHGVCDVATVRYLLTEASLHKPRPDPIDVGALASYVGR